jgi:deferrochelatase/peroxidase EfeB
LAKKVQEGIFYDDMREFKRHGNYSYAIVFFKILDGSKPEQIVIELDNLWQMFKQLKKGRVANLGQCTVPNRGLSILICYGSEVFKIPGLTKAIPKDFAGTQFLPPIKGKPILDGCGINYSEQSCQNVGVSEHIAVQFISGTQLGSYRAIVETWQYLNDKAKAHCLQLTKFFTGFQRDDGRSWLGFHDEVSNMKDEKERREAIAIDRISNQLKPDDFWTEGGTYMGFLRTEIDLEGWDRIGRKDQELIIGRDKRTGSPIIGVDEIGDTIIEEGYDGVDPAEFYDTKYHEHPDYLKTSKVSNTKGIDIEKSRNVLIQSHIGRTRHISNIPSKDPTSRRIFRQGFDFVEPISDEKMPFRLGLNFVSFQNDPRRLIFILTDPRWMGKSNFGGAHDILNDKVLSVLSAGMFFVPARETPFPGYSIFH